MLASGGGSGGTVPAASGVKAAAQAQTAVSSAPPAPVTPPAPVYKVGDTGPAGGIVFYDKGNTSGGWRYMEVAKDDLGKATWGGNVDGTKTSVGTGKQNTQFIAKSGGMAATLCASYQGGGFSDWFLPSKDELNLIYINMVRISHTVDWEDTYWSSSDSKVGSWDSAENPKSTGLQQPQRTLVRNVPEKKRTKGETRLRFVCQAATAGAAYSVC
ncbi:hypothetical protein AGMMS50255_4410 [Spirochaetia bacterium]|nr:hypothetical protein AGMMS50255_4410 [Spirochaetia bacterium]